jgi:hypothetical protein
MLVGIAQQSRQAPMVLSMLIQINVLRCNTIKACERGSTQIYTDLISPFQSMGLGFALTHVLAVTGMFCPCDSVKIRVQIISVSESVSQSLSVVGFILFMISKSRNRFPIAIPMRVRLIRAARLQPD